MRDPEEEIPSHRHLCEICESFIRWHDGNELDHIEGICWKCQRAYEYLKEKYDKGR